MEVLAAEFSNQMMVLYTGTVRGDPSIRTNIPPSYLGRALGGGESGDLPFLKHKGEKPSESQSGMKEVEKMKREEEELLERL